jgi:hypothetical protein
VGFFAKETVDARQAIVPDAPPNVLEPAVFEHSGQDEPRVAAKVEVRQFMFRKEPGQVA